MFSQQRLLGGLVVALVLLISTGSIATAAEPDRIVVGFSQDTLANDWRAAQANDLRRELARFPGTELLVTDGKGSTAKQIRDIEDLVARKVDVLVASPRDSQAMAPVISWAYGQGIPVVLITRGIDGDGYTSLIAPDDAALGREAARHFVKELNGHGDILMLKGVPTASTTALRSAGFISELRTHAGLRLVGVKTGNFLRNDAAQAVEEALHEGLRFDAIFAQSDSMASGARIVLKGAGRDPTKVVIVGIDYISEARDAIRRGEQNASFTYPTCARETAQAVMDIVNGRAVPKRIIVPFEKVTRDNVERVKPSF